MSNGVYVFWTWERLRKMPKNQEPYVRDVYLRSAQQDNIYVAWF